MAIQHELLPLLHEICYIAVERNKINKRRHRARWRKYYYMNALSVVEAHNGSNAKLRWLERRNYKRAREAVIDSIKGNMELLKTKYPNPVKWQSMGLYKLRSLVLQSESEYALAKHQTMEFTIANRARVQYIIEKLQCFLNYDNGSIKTITFNWTVGATGLDIEQIERYASNYELNKAVEKMVEE